MRLFFRLAAGMAFMVAAFAQSAHAQGAPAYVVTYVDVSPNAPADGAALLKRYRDASRKEDGNMRFDVMQEISRPNRFAILAIWKDKAAADSHAGAASAVQFRDDLKTIENAPYDERINNGLYVGPAKSEHPSDPIYVITHVDVIPPSKDDCLAALKAMSVDTPKDPGNISYDVLQQANRSNHFAVLESWTNRQALDQHAMAAHTRAFREKLSPMAGALYDERFYKALD